MLTAGHILTKVVPWIMGITLTGLVNQFPPSVLASGLRTSGRAYDMNSVALSIKDRISGAIRCILARYRRDRFYSSSQHCFVCYHRHMPLLRRSLRKLECAQKGLDRPQCIVRDI